MAEDDGRGWGFPGQKTNFHPPKAFNRHLILHPAVQSKCQVFGEEIWSNFASLRTQNQRAGGCDFSCPDVPTSSADKAVRRGKMSYVLGGICLNNEDIWCKNYVQECATWNDFIAAKSCLKVCAKTLNDVYGNHSMTKQWPIHLGAIKVQVKKIQQSALHAVKLCSCWTNVQLLRNRSTAKPSVDVASRIRQMLQGIMK